MPLQCLRQHHLPRGLEAKGHRPGLLVRPKPREASVFEVTRHEPTNLQQRKQTNDDGEMMMMMVVVGEPQSDYHQHQHRSAAAKTEALAAVRAASCRAIPVVAESHLRSSAGRQTAAAVPRPSQSFPKNPCRKTDSADRVAAAEERAATKVRDDGGDDDDDCWRWASVDARTKHASACRANDARNQTTIPSPRMGAVES